MCYDDQAQPPQAPGANGTAQGREIELLAADGNRFAAYRALPDAGATARLVIFPDIRGLHQFYKDLALRFAEAGVAATAMDYFGRTAGIGPRDESFEFRPHVEQLTLSAILDDAAAVLEDLRKHVPGDVPDVSVGFCLGGTVSLQVGADNLGLDGVIGLYAGMRRALSEQGTLLDRAADIKVPALGLFGGADQGIPAEQVQAFDDMLDTAGVEHEIVIYPGAPHSFFDRRYEEFAAESADAWQRMLRFIAAR